MQINIELLKSNKNTLKSGTIGLIGLIKLFLVCSILFLVIIGGNFAWAESVDHTLPKEDEEIEQPQPIIDSILNKNITYEIRGIEDSTIEDNILAHLYTLPEIKRIHFRFQEEDIIQKVQNAVKVYGFYNSKIRFQFESDKSSNLLIHVDLGKPVYIRKLNISVLGEAVNDPGYMYIFSKNKLKAYTILKHSNYESLKTSMLSQALNLGYFDAKFVTNMILVNVTENFADIHLIINTGRRYRYSSVTYSGDVRYQPIIDELVTIKQGDYYDNDKISSINSSLYETGFFDIAEVHADVRKNKDYTTPVNINLQRRKDNVIELSVGYTTDERWRVKSSWLMPLLNEYGHSLLLQESISAKEKEYLARYKIPKRDPIQEYYYLQVQNSTNDLNDTDSNVFTAMGHVVKKNGQHATLDLGYNLLYEDYIQGVDKGNIWVSGLSASYGYKNSVGRRDLRKGYRIYGQAFWADSVIGSDVDFVQLKASGNFIMSPTRDSRLLFRTDLGANLGREYEKIPPYYRFFTGGDNTVRGFSYKTIAARKEGKLQGGRYLVVGSTELQVPIFKNYREAFFVDTGMAPNHFRGEKFSVGVGTGARYVSPVGLIKFDLAFGVSEVHIPVRVHIGIGVDL